MRNEGSQLPALSLPWSWAQTLPKPPVWHSVMLWQSSQGQWGQTTLFKHQSPLRTPDPHPEQGTGSPHSPPEPAPLFGQSLFPTVLPRGNLSSFSLIQGQTHTVAGIKTGLSTGAIGREQKTLR